jgi:putative addiction module component (TIGR02574 family)
MTIDINSLLNLPQKERQQIAEKLWDSLSPNNSVSKEDASTITLLEKRRQDIQEQKIALFSPSDLRAKIQEHRKKLQ